MDMSSSSTSISMSPSMTMSSAAAASSSSAASTMSMGDDSCKISMTWNWYTVGACFISKTWHVTSSSVFAGSCIGVVCLVISLEFLRRIQREYETFVRRRGRRQHLRMVTSLMYDEGNGGGQAVSKRAAGVDRKDDTASVAGRSTQPTMRAGDQDQSRAAGKASLLQSQLIRALLHTVQFGVAYFIMLLAMYYNGYIIICILIGAFLGSFIFTWDQLVHSTEQSQEDTADITGCCG